MLCILSVFIPTFILNEPVRSLFMPLTLAVGFAMIASYLLSSTLVPVLSVWLGQARGRGGAQGGLFDRVLPRFARIVEVTVRHRWIVALAYLAACGLLLWLFGGQVGTELFPEVDSGQFVLRFRAPPGSEYEVTRKCASKILEVIDKESARQAGDVDGLRRPGRHEHRHEQHPAVHARPATTAVLRVRLRERQRRRDRRTPRAAAQGPAGAGRALAHEALGAARTARRKRRRPSPAGFPSVSSRATSSAR